ncbi:acetyl-CoA carboxylase, carboxyltransferase subunit beta [Lentzea guizhouensis]|uniref:acetyl-CoA carboxylase, carboxyltransferase subunit beta n=1 Tax=Lentzea guizhouensis TaxID=1586287 RepID=UPI000B334A57|nr:acetyl-CoA carboxylase, carboxyltransferase subunit beta [Lentzea guizhouensis]
MNDKGRAILARLTATPDGTWLSCASCRSQLHGEKLRRSLGVCAVCGYHFRLPARERIESLVDKGSFAEQRADVEAADPLGFVDREPYSQRLSRARESTGLTDAVIAGVARTGGHPVVLVVLDFGFMGGSMGAVVGETVTTAAETALRTRTPLVVVSSSGGARMQEGVFSLLQMAKTSAAVGRLRAAGVPFVSVLADPVYGGVAASFAALGDMIIAESGARAGFAGPKVIEQTIRQRLPEDFQTAGFLLEHGHVDMVVDRAGLAATVRAIIAWCSGDATPPVAAAPATAVPVRCVDAWEAVRAARDPKRPNATDYIGQIFTGFVELHGDRAVEDDQAVVGGIAWLDDTPVVVVGSCKGEDTRENVRRNFGMPQPSGYRKAARLFELAQRAGKPVITFVDTPGAHPGIRAEEGNQSAAIAELITLSAGLRVPIVTVITGEGGSGGALALATGDRLLVQENAVYSVISPEGCATILFGDAGRAPQAARALRVDAAALLGLGVADELVPEPPGGAQTDPAAARRSPMPSAARWETWCAAARTSSSPPAIAGCGHGGPPR